MANTLKLEIVTPEARTYSDEVDMVTLPGVEGEMGIYPMHVPLMTQIVAGEVVIRKDGQDQFFAVGDGFVEITACNVAILTDMAVKSDDIDEMKAEEARRRVVAGPYRDFRRIGMPVSVILDSGPEVPTREVVRVLNDCIKTGIPDVEFADPGE